MEQVGSYIPPAHRIEKGGRTDEGTRMDPQVSAPADVGGRSGVPVGGERRELAEALIEEGSGGSGGPPRPATFLEPRPRPEASMESKGLRITPPGERRIYRVGGSLFRVWADRHDAGAEFYKAGMWVWTPIPGGSIIGHPDAEELSVEEVRKLRLSD